MPPVFSFAPLWSLQVEEQFYLLFPVAVLFLSRAHLRRLLIICVVAARHWHPGSSHCFSA